MTARLLGGASLRAQAALGIVSALVTSLLLVPIYALTNASLGIPLFYEGDANFHGMLIKGVLERGWYYESPLLSAPAGQQFRDFPMPDNLHLVIIRALGVVVDSYAVAMNVYYLAGFALTAFVTTFLLRRLHFTAIVSVAIGILYALAPYHFSRNQNHLFLATYWTVPFGMYLAMGVLGHVPLFERRPGMTGAASWFTWTTSASIGMAVLVASGSGYYGVFTALLLGTATVAALAQRRGPSVVPGLVLMGVVLITMLVNLAPHLLQTSLKGGNEQSVVRSPGSGEYYSLKLTRLILPIQEHRVAPLASLAERYVRDFPLPSESHSLGTLGAVGLVGIIWALIVALARRDRSSDERAVALILFTVTALLVATPGGFSSLIELLATPILRGWNRLSIFIMLFGLMFVGLLFDKLWVTSSRNRRPALATLCLLVTAFGVWDQTSDRFRPAYASNRDEFLSDREFFGRLEAVLPPGSMVFQLPAMEFPEAGPVNAMDDYDHLRGFLHSDQLRWSYGGIKGRTSADWPVRLDDEPAFLILPKLAAVGFSGIYIDRQGYADRAAQLERELSSLIGAEPLVSRNARLSFFDMRVRGRALLERLADAQRDALRESTLEPVELEWHLGFYGEEQDSERRWRWASGSAVLRAEVPGRRARQVVLTFGVAAPGAEASIVRIEASDGASQEISVGRRIEAHVIELRLQPGANRITFSTDAPAITPPGEKRDLRIKLFDLRVEDRKAVEALAGVHRVP